MQIKTEAKNSVILVLGTVATAGLSILYSRHVGLTLGPELYSDFTTALAIISISMAFSGLINPTVARFSAEYNSRNEPGKIYTLTVAVGKRVVLYGLAVVLLALAVMKPLGNWLRFESAWTLLVVGLVVYLFFPLSVVRGVLRGTERYGALNGSNIIEAGSRLLLGMLLLHFVTNVTAGLLAYVAGVSLALAIAPFQLRRIWQGSEAEPVDGDAVRKFTLPVFLMTMITIGFQNVDMLVAKRVFTGTDAGIYGAAAQLGKLMGVLVTPFSTLILPLLTNLYERGQSTTEAFLRVCGYFLVLVSVPMGVLIIWPEWILVGVYDSRFTGGGEVLTFISAARLLGYLSHMVTLLFAARNHFGFLRIYIPGLAVMLAALTLLHDTPTTMSIVVFVVESIVLTAMVIYLWSQKGRGKGLLATSL